ncbi:MAG TPA: phage virion morphogenesis protein [Devosia sp.]|jgi:phage virion morphogenesis protein|nr:phage virion morphogenesis protein [Devosia sp.]
MAGVSHNLGSNGALEALDRLERAADNPAGAYHRLGGHFITSTRRNFERETAPDGSKWAPLSPRYAASRVGRNRRRGFDHILNLIGRLQDSVNYNVLLDGVEWGSNLDYARPHQLGATINMPARSGTVNIKNIRRKGNRFVRLGTQGGESRITAIRGHSVRIPARPFLGISDYDRAEVPAIIEDYLREEAGQ